MSINITDEITAEYEKYMREVIDYGFTGTPITRLDVGYHESIVTFAAGYQVANTKQAARLAELEAQLSDLDKLKLDIENALKAIAEYDQENTDLKAQLAAVQKDAAWIPVSERWPEQGAWVLACIYIPENIQQSICIASMHHGFLYIDPNSKYKLVTHWMPLPKPPIAGEAT